MSKITDLESLIKEVGKETVDKIVVEYLLMMQAKANKFDELQEGKESK